MGMVRMYGYGQNVYIGEVTWLVGGVVRRYIDFLILLLIPIYSPCIRSFLQQHPYILLCSFYKCFFCLFQNLNTTSSTRILKN